MEGSREVSRCDMEEIRDSRSLGLKVDAARRLGIEEGPEALERLGMLLDDPEGAVALTAATGLARRGMQSFDTLIDALRRRSSGTALAERCLAEIKAPARALLSLLDEPGCDAALQASLLAVLGATGDASVVADLVARALEGGDLASAEAAARGVRRTGLLLDAELLGRALLESVHDRLSEEAARALSSRPEATGILVAVAAGRRTGPAGQAFEALVSTKMDVEDALLRALESPDPLKASVSALALAKRGRRRAAPPAREAANRAPLSRPASMALNIYSAGEAELAEAVSSLSGVEEPQTLLASAAALAKRGESRAAVELLMRVISTGEGAFDQGAVFMLSGCGRPGLDALVDLIRFQPRERWIAARAACEIDIIAKAAPVLSGMLNDPCGPVRWAAAWAPATCGSPPAIEAAMEALERGDYESRRMGALLLRRANASRLPEDQAGVQGASPGATRG